MRVLCRHGHFAFYPRYEYEVFIFSDLFSTNLVRSDDYYTFPLLQNAEKFSLIGKLYCGLPAITRYEGEPWEILRENNFVYDIQTGLLVPKASIVLSVKPQLVGQYSVIDYPILQPGSLNEAGQKIMSYDAEFLQDKTELRIIEYSYE